MVNWKLQGFYAQICKVRETLGYEASQSARLQAFWLAGGRQGRYGRCFISSQESTH